MKKPPSIKQEAKIKAKMEQKEYFTRKEKDNARIAGIATLIIILSVIFMFFYSLYQSL